MSTRIRQLILRIRLCQAKFEACIFVFFENIHISGYILANLFLCRSPQLCKNRLTRCFLFGYNLLMRLSTVLANLTLLRKAEYEESVKLI